MTDLAALGLSIDSNGVVKASADLDKFAASSDKAAAGAAKVGSASSNTTSSTVKMAQGIAAAQSKIDAATSSTFRLAEGFDALTGKMNPAFLAINRNLQALGTLPGKMNQVTGSAGAMRAGMQQAGFQVSDFFVQIGSGTSAIRAAAQQMPQLTQAISLMGMGAGEATGIFGTFAKFMSGPWGVAVTVAVSVLGALAGSLLTSSSASDTAKDSAEDLAKSIAALREEVEKETSSTNTNTAARLENANAMRRQTEEALKLARADLARQKSFLAGANAQASNAMSSDQAIEAENRASNARKEIAASSKEIDKLEGQLGDTGKAIRGLQGIIIGNTLDGYMTAGAKATAKYTNEQDRLNKQFRDGAIDAGTYAKQLYAAKQTLATEEKAAQASTGSHRTRAAAISEEQKAYNDASKAADNYIARLGDQISRIGLSESETRKLEAARAADAAATKEQAMVIGLLSEQLEKEIANQEYLNTIKQAKQATAGLQDEVAQLDREAQAVGLVGWERERLLNILETEAKIRPLLVEQADAELKGQTALSQEIQKQIDLLMAISGIKIQSGDRDDAIAKNTAAIEQMLDLLDSAADRTNQAAQGMADAFGSVGDAIGKLATQFADYGAIRARIDAEIKKAEDSKDFAKAADLREKAQANQIDNYRMLAGTAKTFFKEGSTGYKTLAAAEKAFAVVQLANTAVNIAAGAAKMFASLGPFAFPAVAAMIAIMAGLGFASRGGSGKAPASAEQVQAAQGTGTVLGDPTGKSESIARALDIVADNTNNMLEYDNSMLRSLRSIDDNIGALTSQLAKQLGAGGAFDTGNLGLGTNTSGGLLGGFPVVGAVLGALFGKTTTTKSLFDQGLQFNPQMLADAIANGIAGSTYQIVETVKKKSGFLGLGSSTKTSYQTTTGALDSDMQKQVGLILGSLRDSVVGAAKIIGLDVADALNAFQVEIGKISFKDMSSSEIEAALQAAFSKVGDQMAGFAVDGLEAFQQAGEGLFETLIRLAKDYQTIDVTLKSIGKTFGAVGASSIAARESLIALFGTLDDFVEATSFYQQNFLTPAQQIGPVQQQVQSTLAGLGLSGVDTIAEFKAVVDGIDLTTEAGQQLYASMMQLAPAFYAVEQYQQQQAQVAADLAKQKAQLEIQLLQAQGKTAEAQARQRQLELAAADASLRPLMQQIYAAQDAATAAAAKAEALTGAKDALSKAYETESAAIQQTADKMRDLGDSLRDFRASLTSDELTANPAALAAKFREVGRMASLGDQTAMGNLPQVAKDYLDSVKANATSEQDYLRALAEVKRYTDSAIGAADQGVSVAEQQLEALKTLVGGYIDINNSVLTVGQAILNLTALLNPASPTPVTPVTPVTQEQQDREDEREQRKQDREDERQKRLEDALARLKIQNDDTKRMWNQILAGALPITVRTDTLEPLEVVTP